MSKRTISPLLLGLIITALCLPLVPVPAQNVDFKLTANPTQIMVGTGDTATYNLSVIPIGGFNSTVNLQVTGGLPPGVQASIEPASVTPGIGHSVLTIPLSLTTPSGSYNITITGVSSSGIEHSVIVGLTIAGGKIAFSLEASPAVSSGGLELLQGQCGNYTVSVLSFVSGSVNLTVPNQPSRVAMHFTQNSLTLVPGGLVSTILQVCPTAEAQPGNYTLTILGTGNVPNGNVVTNRGTEVHAVDILLKVTSQTNTQRPIDLFLHFGF